MRFRSTGWYNEVSDVVVSHCTIDSGEDTPQTAVTFRSTADGYDIVSVTRPYPKSTNSSYDSAYTVKG